MSGYPAHGPSRYVYNPYSRQWFDGRTLYPVDPSVVHHAMMHMASPMVPVAMPAPVASSVNALTSQMHGVSIESVYPIRYFVYTGEGEKELPGGIYEFIDMVRRGSDVEIIVRGVSDKDIRELFIWPAAGEMEIVKFNKKRDGSKGEQTFRLKHFGNGPDIFLSYFLTNFNDILKNPYERDAVLRRRGGRIRRKTHYRNKKGPAKKRRTMKGK